MLIKSNFLMSEIPIFTLAIAANISTNDHLERAGVLNPLIGRGNEQAKDQILVSTQIFAVPRCPFPVPSPEGR
jgi:hypothetical protein